MKFPKINFNQQIKHIERLITDNSPMILTALGVVGVGTTAVLTWRSATAAEIVVADAAGQRNLNREASDPYYTSKSFTAKEKFGLTWKLYIGPFVVGTLTCASIIGAQKINARRAAAIAGVLAMTQDDLKAYKTKVEEKLTGPKNRELKEDLARDNVNKALANHSPVHVANGQVLCVEAWTGRPFACEYNKLLQGENEINRKILKENAASLSDFYDVVGLEHTDPSDNFGWNTSLPFELEMTPIETNDHRPAYSVVYVEPPVYRPWESGSFR